MKNRKNRFIPLLSLLLCTVVMMSFSLPAMAADPQAIEGFFTNFNGNENFSSAVWTVTTATGATTEGTGSASVDSNGVISVSVLAGSDSCGPVTSTITVTLTAKKTISFQYTLTDNDKGTLSLAYASGGTSSKDGKNYAVVKENDIVKFELSCEYNSESNKATGTITITDIQEATSKVPDDCASYSVGGTAYSYLDLAIIAASSGSDKVILVTNDGTVYHSSIEKENTEAHIKDFTIPDGVTLMVPYSNDAESNSNPLTEPTMVKEADKDGTKTLTRTLKVPSDVRIYCEGNIRVDAKQYACSQRQTGHVRDNYAKIILDGEIHLKGSGTLRAYGYITGNGFVDAESGNIYELFQISDWRGGTVTSAIKSKLQNESFLISSFYIQNIETDLIVHSQANLSAYMAIAAGYGSAKDPYNSEVKLIADDGLFALVSDDTQVTREYSSGRMTYKIDGDSSLGAITVQIARVESINSNDYVLNLPSSMTIELVDGTCTMPIRVKLLPGAEVKVHKGATLEMTGSSQLILYDYDVWTAGKFTYTGTFYEATHSEGTRMKSLPKSHGKLTVDGTLKIGDGSAVYTTTGYSSKTVDVGTTAITGSGTIQIGKAPSSLRTVIKEVQNNDKSTSDVTVAPAVLKNTSGTQTATNGKTFKNTDGKWICDVDVNAHVDSNTDELCDVCGTAVKHTHSYTVATVRAEALKQPASCTAQAVYYKSCACGDISTNDAEIFSSGDMIPHDMSRTVEAAVAATCTKNGKTAVMGCSRCAYTEGGAVEPANGHAYTAKSDAEDALVTPATCQSNAVYKAMCAVCSDKNTDETFEEANSKLQHSYTGGWDTPTDAGHAKLCVNGCGQANPVVSEHAYENACDTDCACGYTRTAPHSFATMKDSGVLANPASCTANQQNKVQCDNCTAISETLTVEVAGTQLPHTCDQTKAEDKYLKTKANCQSAAVYYKSCVCGAFSSADDAATFSNGSEDANNHVNANSTWEKTEAGHRNYWACCGADIVPQAEHSYVNGVCSLEGCAYACTHTGGQLEYTSNDNSTHKAVYDCCGKVESEAAAHTPGQWTITQAATCVAPGSEQAACTACNATVTREIGIDGNAHNRAEAWIPTPDGRNHYQMCQNEGCVDMGTLGEHADTTKDHKCDTCGYEMSKCADGEDADHKCDYCGTDGISNHVYDTQKHDKDKHWKECACGEKSDEAAHTCEAVVTPPSFTAGGYTTYTCSCGYSYKDDFKDQLTAVAQIGDDLYQSLADAIAAAKSNDTIVLLADVENPASFDPVVLPANVTLNLNGKTITGTVAGRIEMEGGTLKTYADNNETVITMAGPENSGAMYITSNAVFVLDTDWSMTVASGSASLGQNWQTLPGQSVTIASGAKVTIPEGKTFTIRGNVVVEGQLTCNGAIVLENQNATLTIAQIKDLNISTPEEKAIVWYDNGQYVVHFHTAGEAVVENEAAATCTAAGSYDTVVYCTVCDAELSRVPTTVTATGHTAGEAVVENEVAATCTADGSYDTVVYCTVCDAELSRVPATVPATGHTAGEVKKKNEVAPTCTEAGSYDLIAYCTVCGAEASKETVEVKATGHTTVTKEAEAATCTETGWTEGSHCSVCNVVFEAQTITPALGHDYKATVTAPTCTEDGYTTHTCSRCNDSYVDNEIAATGHSYGEAPVTTEPTCTTDGEKQSVCSACGDIKKETVAATGHSYETVVTAPTCTEKGYTTYTCHCGDTYVDGYTNPIGHTEEVIPGREATCTVTGLTEGKKCSVCDVILQEQIEYDANGHTEGAAVEENRNESTCTVAGSYDSVVYCSVCDAELSRTKVDLELAAHTLEYVEANEATCTEGGNEEYWQCKAEGCGKLFADAEGQTETDADKVKTEANGHTVKAEFTWAEDFTCTVKLTCEKCETVLVESAACEISEQTEEATCVKEGKTTYTASYTYNNEVITNTETKTETIPATGKHTYVDGVCKDCGETEVVLYSDFLSNMNLANALNMQFAFRADYRSDWSGCYVEVVKSYADGTTQTQITNYSNWGKTTINGVRHYYVAFNGIAAKEMTDNVYVTIYDANENPISITFCDSPRNYAIRTLNNPASTDIEKTMIVDMLNYGATAQKYFQNYHGDDLANSTLTEEQRAFATESVNCKDSRIKGKNYLGSSLRLVSRIELMLAFKNITQSMYAVVTYEDKNGNMQEVTIDGSQFEENNGAYVVIVNSIVVAEARSDINCKVYSNGDVVAEVTDSVESYSSRTEGELFDNIMKFSDSARAFLASK